MFSPRGLGKSHYAVCVAVRQAKAGRKVLLIDRDNTRPIVRERLQGFGATKALKNIKVISREKAPRLTDAAAWALFPYSKYDIVVIDSLNSSAEGIGEQDSAKPSKALAPLLDVCHREGGPAVLLLDNTVRTGAHSRGSGVIEDRADIVFEVRDATGFSPTGKKHWWEELPPADAGSWGERVSRRKGRKVFRLAFVATKFRVGPEPEPFSIEIDLTKHQWEVRDVTDLVDQAGKETREATRRERAERLDVAAKALKVEIEQRQSQGEPALAKERGAVPFLQRHGLTRVEARTVLEEKDGILWQLQQTEGVHGNAVLVVPLEKENGTGGANSNHLEPLQILGENDSHLRRPHEQDTAQIPSLETPVNASSLASHDLRRGYLLPGEESGEWGEI
jgi:hypothetical protein